MSQTLKDRTVNGVQWSLIDKFGVVFIKLITVIVLSRILDPVDFGIIGMIAVLFDVASDLGVSGFGQAYIQKHSVNKKDIATVFYVGVLLSILFFFSFWFLSPFISKYYNQPVLDNIIKVFALVVIIDAFRAIRTVEAIRNVDFKKLSLANILSGIISGVIAIYMAVVGYGIWSLVAQAILSKLILSIVLWYKQPLIRLRDFSASVFKGMFSFSSWILLTTIVRRFFDSVNVLVIGRFFPVEILGFYTKAKQYQDLSTGQITQAVSQVAFPVLSSVNSSREKLKSGIRNFLEQTQLIVILLIVLFLVTAKSFVIILLTEKWEPMIVFFKLFCIVGLLFPINTINTQLLISQGYSRENFMLVIIKNVLRIINLFSCYRFGVLYIVIGEVVISVLSLFINTYYTRKHIGYGLFQQLYHLRVIFAGGTLAFVSGSVVTVFVNNLYLEFLLGSIITLVVYILIQYKYNRSVMIPAIEQFHKWIKNIT